MPIGNLVMIFEDDPRSTAQRLRTLANLVADYGCGDDHFLCELADRIQWVGEPAFLGIARQRMKQVLTKGYDAAHDDEHDRGELALAAACYALAVTDCTDQSLIYATIWPFEQRFWKPKGKRHNLEVAAALIVAELARLQRKDERVDK